MMVILTPAEVVTELPPEAEIITLEEAIALGVSEEDLQPEQPDVILADQS
jgi:hypothetical protein